MINLVPTPSLFDVALINAFVGNFDNINQHETKRAIHSRKSKGGRRGDFHLLMQLESMQNDGEFTRTMQLESMSNFHPLYTFFNLTRKSNFHLKWTKFIDEQNLVFSINLLHAHIYRLHFPLLCSSPNFLLH